jgi:hypothetical protein
METLPESVSRQADIAWNEEVSRSGLVQPQEGQGHVHYDHLLQPDMAASTNAFALDFKLSIQMFQKELPKSFIWDDIAKINSIDHIYDITDKIQASQQKCDGLRDLTRIRLYLQRLESYTAVARDIIPRNCDALALLWGPVGLLLQWAATHDKAYESLINSIAEIAQVLPDFQASAATFSRSMETKEILVLFFEDILNFYLEASQPFGHQSILIVLS